MRLQELLSDLGIGLPGKCPDPMNPEIRSLEYDSRRVTNGSLFFAVKGAVTDGHLYVPEALRRGAVAVASECQAPPGFPRPWIRVQGVRPFLARMSNRFHHHPSRRLKLVGITGTNGKTTTAFVLHAILNQESEALLMGTIKTLIGGRELESNLTTPEASDIQRILAEAVRTGCRRGVIEVSSHALCSHRVFQCHFPVAVFTNLTQDHLDFHGTLKSYFQAKCRLFRHDHNPALKYAVVNGDDLFGARINLAEGVKRVTFGLSEQSDVHPVSHRTSLEGTHVDLKFFDRRLSLRSSLCGEHNLYNIMAAATAASLLGIVDSHIQEGVEALRTVPGRLERVNTRHPCTVIVDYAHTPDALENVLKFCRSLSGGRVICVFGCGGDRDRGKRPQMGSIAVRNADFAVVTSDNPRHEDPEEIVREICAGISQQYDNYEVIIDRRQAIVTALRLAREEDLVLLAGKGHENYQDVQGERIHFDDREVVREVH